MKKLLLFTATVLYIQICSAQFTVLHQFNGNDGRDPLGALVQSGSTLYGMTFLGGSSETGTIFSINNNGTDFKLLHSFVSASIDGVVPSGSLLLLDTVLYGMAGSDEETFISELCLELV
jgi:uncharacterized repeat protein (TIGR03803 family)